LGVFPNIRRRYLFVSQTLFDMTTVFSTFMLPKPPKDAALAAVCLSDIRKKWGR
jgi:hypothetical protein